MSSSEFSTERRRASSLPAMIKSTFFLGQPNVGYSSTPSWTPILADVPEPQ